MNDDWLTTLLVSDSSLLPMPGAPSVMPGPQMASGIASARARGRGANGTYITPPSLRKTDAGVAQARVPVLAVKVEASTSEAEDGSMHSRPPSQPSMELSKSSLPARREKRSRKGASSTASSADGYASSGESPPCRPRHSNPAVAPAMVLPVRREKSHGASSTASTSDARPNDALLSTLLPLCPEAAVNDVHTLIAPEAFAEMTLDRDELQEEGSDSNDGPSGGMPEANRRKVRHNLTERRRVDRMNQLFHKLYTALEEEGTTSLPDSDGKGPQLSVLGADGKPINPNRWSKADVLEGALNVIRDLRHQLAEERLARSLGVGGVRASGMNSYEDDGYGESVDGDESDEDEFGSYPLIDPIPPHAQ